MVIFDVAAFGTSLTENTIHSIATGQWQESLQRFLTPGRQSRVRVYNAGIGGATSAQGLANIERVLRFRPKVVTLEFNMNDCATSFSISPSQSQTNHVSMINAIQSALPNALIYLLTMNPPIGAAVSGRPNIESYNDVYRSLAASLQGVDIIDTAPLWAGATTAELPDNVHPTLAALNSKVVPAIAAALAPIVP